MESCKGCAVAQAGYGFTTRICANCETRAVEELEETNPGAHTLNPGDCEYEKISTQVQNAIDHPSRIIGMDEELD